MTARQDRKGKYHNTLDQPLLDSETAAELKKRLGILEPDADRAQKAAKVHKAAQRKPGKP